MHLKVNKRKKTENEASYNAIMTSKEYKTLKQWHDQCQSLK